MSKIEISSNTAPFPKPIVLVGSSVEGRPNFITVAWFNRLNGLPNIWAIALGKNKYTIEGIRENGSFSINIPSTELIEKTDFCGLHSGREVDKSTLFDVFYGRLANTPMIRECPVNAECAVYEYVELPKTLLILGEVKHVYTEERFMTDGVLDPAKIDPIIFTRPGDNYRALGEIVGDAWSIGKNIER